MTSTKIEAAYREYAGIYRQCRADNFARWSDLAPARQDAHAAFVAEVEKAAQTLAAAAWFVAEDRADTLGGGNGCGAGACVTHSASTSYRELVPSDLSSYGCSEDDTAAACAAVDAAVACLAAGDDLAAATLSFGRALVRHPAGRDHPSSVREYVGGS